jgi:DNA polymerase-3 subunit alpha
LIGKRLILGFILVAGIEAQLVVPILEERKRNGRFKSFEDLMRRCHIPLEQLALLIRIGALRDFDDDRKTLLWKAHFHHQHQLVKSKTAELFETPFVKHELPILEENSAESTFEQIELLGFSLCNPFDLLDESLPPHTFASELAQHLGTRIEMYGYLVAIKQSRTSKGDIMNFGTFIDQKGDTIDTVHFPESVRKFPFYGKGIYRLVGVITEEFGYFSLEVGQMEKLRLMDDVRFGDVEKIENPSTHKEAS